MIGKKQRMMGILWFSAAVLAVTLLLYAIQDRLIYFPRPYGSLDDLPERVSRIDFQTSEGNQTCFYLSPRDSSSPLPPELWVLFGGNASLALNWLEFAGRYPDSSTGFLLIDYPGYGLCEGKPTPATILESSRKALTGLAMHLNTQREELESRTSVLGHSLGAAAGLEFAATLPVRRLVLISPFTSLHDMARRSVGTPLCYLLRHDFDNRARLRDLLNTPLPPHVTIIHGEWDEVVPVEMGRELAGLFPGRLEYREIPRGDHNSIVSQAEPYIVKQMQGE